MKKEIREQYKTLVGLKLGDHFPSEDYCTDDAKVREVKDGAWVRTWIFVYTKELEDLED